MRLYINDTAVPDEVQTTIGTNKVSVTSIGVKGALRPGKDQKNVLAYIESLSDGMEGAHLTFGDDSQVMPLGDFSLEKFEKEMSNKGMEQITATFARVI